jgi:hypothetical protein
LWQCASRRHPRENRFWIKGKYFLSVGNRNWTFAVDTGEHFYDGKPILMRREMRQIHPLDDISQSSCKQILLPPTGRPILKSALASKCKIPYETRKGLFIYGLSKSAVVPFATN